MNEQLVITEENFEEYFFDVRKHKIKQGQVIASYKAKAAFIDSSMKRDIIDLLKKDKAYAATRIMKNFHGAVELDAIRVPKEMTNDLLNGMSDDEVSSKEYDMTVEYFFYTQKEHIPDDIHWSCISVRNMDELLSPLPDGTIIKSKIVSQPSDKES